MTKINENIESVEVENQTIENQERCTDNPCAANPCAANPCEDNGEANGTKAGGQVDLFAMMGIAPPPAPKAKANDKPNPKKETKKKGPATKSNKPAKKANTLNPEKLPKDLPIFVVLTNHNYQNTFEPGTTLEEIRQQLELEYPFLTKQNTKWTVEVQKLKDGRVYYEEVKPSEDAEDKDTTDGDNAEQPEEVLEEGVTKRIIAIPTAMSNKAG